MAAPAADRDLPDAPHAAITPAQRKVVEAAFAEALGAASQPALAEEETADADGGEGDEEGDGDEGEDDKPKPAAAPTPAPAGDGTITSAQMQAAVSKIFGAELIETDFLFLLDANNKADSDTFTYEEFELAVSQHMIQTTKWGSLATNVSSYVGFDMLAQQVHRRKLKAGFQFNVMVAGQSGLGKTTMVDTLFGGPISRQSQSDEARVIPQTVDIESVSHVIEEKGIRLRLTVVDAPGFGDQLNNVDAWNPLIEYQNEQFERYYSEETAVFRKRELTDTRVHCLLYFIAPTGHSLRPFDIEAMRNLSMNFNLVPVIAKSDSMTLEERNAFRSRIQADIEVHEIHVYPQIEEDDDEEDKAEKEVLYRELPYAVVGSNTAIEVGGKKVLGRKLPWSVVEVENPAHCEYNKLRDMLIRTRMHDLIETTHIGQYAEYRVDRIDPQGDGEEGEAV